MQEEISQLIEQKDFKKVKELLSEMLVPDLANLLESLEEPSVVVKVFRLIPKDLSAEVFAYIEDYDLQEDLVNLLTDKELASIMEELSTDDAVDFIEEMPTNVVDRALKISTPETRKIINKFLSYEDDTAGAIMTAEFVSLRQNMTANQAMERVKQVAENVETINVLFVTDETKILKGVLSIRDLLIAPEDKLIKDIMQDNLVYAYTNTDQEEIARLFTKYDFLAMPVVDKENRLVGIVTIDDAVEVLEDEVTEDFEAISGTIASDKPYLKTNAFRIFLNRLPWLLILMISATFTGIILNNYENALSFSVCLTACIPMIMDTGGNAGGQASITIIRGIALKEIEFKDIFSCIWKEVRVSFMLAISLGLVCFAKLQIIDNLILGFDYSVIISFVVSLALSITVIIAKVVGCTLPLIVKKCHLDPAVVASPFITTIVDALSLLIYCNIALAILG